MRAVLQGSEQVAARAERVVDNQWQVVLFGNGRDGFKIRNAKAGVADGFQVDSFGVGINEGLKAGRIISVGEAGFDAQALKRHLELDVGAAVEVRRGHEVVAGLHDVVQGDELGRLARARRQGRHAAFEGRYALLKHVGGGVHQAGVDVAELLQSK